jgi:transposase
MVGVSKIEIRESCAQLNTLMHQQSRAMAQERLQVLYLLKSRQAKDITTAAQLIGRDRTTVQRWLQKYQQGGISQLIAARTGQGRKRVINASVNQALEAELAKPSGFKSDGAIQDWLQREHGLAVRYGTVHLQVRDRLGAKLKVPRPRSAKQDAGAVRQFKKPSRPDSACCT